MTYLFLVTTCTRAWVLSGGWAMLDRRTRRREMGGLALIAILGLTACGGGTARTVSVAVGGTTTSTAVPEPATSTTAPTSTTSPPSTSVARSTAPTSRPTTTAPGPTTTTIVVVTTAGPATTAVPKTTVTTKKPRKRLPGPPGPISPKGNATDIWDTVHGWYDQLVGEVPTGACQPLLDSTRKTLSAPVGELDEARKAYATLYRGTAEGCLGQVAAATSDLNQAKTLLAVLATDTTGNQGIDRTCQPEQLLAWAYDSYLDQTVAVVCPPKQ